jgi:hypothetical protein
VYFQIQNLIDNPDADLSAYRLQLQGVWHVAVVGDAPDKELAEELEKVMAAGELVELPNIWEEELQGLITRHASGDWGDLGEEDKRENELSVRQGFRIFSAYTTSSGIKVWVITEADRCTCI